MNIKRFSIILLTILMVVVFISAQPVFGDTHDGDEEEITGPEPELQDFDITDVEKNFNKENRVSYDITILAQTEKHTYPYIHPVDVDVTYDDNDFSDTVLLSPTDTEQYVPSVSSDQNDHVLSRTLTVDMEFFESEETLRDIEFNAESRLTGDETNFDVDNINVEGADSSDNIESEGSISIEEDVNRPTETSFVTRYRSSDIGEDPDPLESLQIPAGDSDLTGEVSEFENMRSVDRERAFMRSMGSGLDIITHTQNLETSEPQTISISYDILSGESVEITPLDESGSEITELTTYELPRNANNSENCSVFDGQNVCNITLSDVEQETINNLGELYLRYESDEDIFVSVQCQAVISGYLPYNSENNACGQSTTGGENEPRIDDFDGRHIPEHDETEFFDPVHVTESNDEQSGEVELRVQLIDIDFDSEEDVVLKIYEENDINEQSDNREFEGETVYEIPVDSDTGVVKHTDERDYGEFPDSYVSVLCYENSDCTATDNITFDMVDVIPLTEGGDGPELNTSSVVYLTIPVEETDETEIGTELAQVPDSDFDSTRSNDYIDENWTQIDVEENFTGSVSQRVVVEEFAPDSDLTDEEVIYEASQIAEDYLLADLSSGDEWNRSSASIVAIDTESELVTENEVNFSEEWENRGFVRTAQVGTETEEIFFLNGNELRDLTASDEGWYLDRHMLQSAPLNSVPTQERVQTINPDECINCIQTETINSAQSRLGDGFIVGFGTDHWESAGKQDERRAELLSVNEKTTGVIPTGWSKIADEEFINDTEDVYRNYSFESREMIEWVQEKDLREVEFKRPEVSEVTEYARDEYSISYTYEENVEDESLYTWERTVVEEHPEEYGEVIHWFDFSESKRGDFPLDEYEIEFGDNGPPRTYDWTNYDEETPEERVCDGETTLQEYNTEVDRNMVYEICEDDGVIMNIGHVFEDPGTYTTDVTLYDTEGQEDSETVTMNVEPDDVDIGESFPARLSGDIVNDRYDYQTEQIIFDLEILGPPDGDLRSNYAVELDNADVYRSVRGCPAGYNEDFNWELAGETVGQDILQQTRNCILIGFEDPDEFPETFDEDSFVSNDEFILYESNVASGEVTDLNTGTIPAGSIQSCSGILSTTSEDNTCEIRAGDTFSEEDIEIQYEENGEYVDIDNHQLRTCPVGFETNVDDDHNDIYQNEGPSTGAYDRIVTCEAEEVSLETANRDVTIEYKSPDVQGIDACEQIRSSMESESIHTDELYNGTDDGSTHECDLNAEHESTFIASDIGDQFELYTEQDFRQYNDIPPGVIRGETFTSDNHPCTTTVEDPDTNELHCILDTSGEQNVGFFGYAEIERENWNSNDIQLDDISEQPNTESENVKSIWNDNNLVVDNREDQDISSESITGYINPRESDVSTGENEFTAELINLDTGEVVDSVTREIELCRTQNLENQTLVESPQTPSTCENFDTLLTGEDDFDSERTTVSDVLEQTEDLGENEVRTVEVESPINDACPYNRIYPRGPVDGDNSFEIEITSNTSESFVEEQVETYTQSLYSVRGDICEDIEQGQAPPLYSSENEFVFEGDTIFDSNPRSVDNIRVAGLSDIESFDDNPTLNEWSGAGLRLGTPVTYTEGMNENLVSLYPFDHNINLQENTNDARNIENFSNNYKVTDAFSDDHVLHARIMYGHPCVDSIQHSAIDEDIITNTEYIDTYQGEYDRSMNGYVTCDEEITKGPVTTPEDPEFIAPFNEEDPDINVPIHNNIDNIDEIDGIDADGYAELSGNNPASLPFPPTEDNFERAENDNVRPIDTELDQRYEQNAGVFGGNALVLEEHSWLALPTSTMGEDFNVYNQFSSLYDHSTNIDSPDITMRDRLTSTGRFNDNNDDYTISFWVKPEIDPDTFAGHEKERPVTTIANIENTHPETGNVEPLRNTHSTFSAHYMREDPVHYAPQEPSNPDYREDWIPESDQCLSEISSTFKYSGYISDRPMGIVTPIPVEHESEICENFDHQAYINTDRSFGSDEFCGPDGCESGSQFNPGSWNHVAITYSENQDDFNGFEFWVNGHRSSAEDLDALEDERFVDFGELTPGSTISFGAKQVHQDRNQGHIPTIEASAGEVKIDELAVYDESMVPRQDFIFNELALSSVGDGPGLTGQTSNVISGEVRSGEMIQDSDGQNLDEISVNDNIDIGIEGKGDGRVEVEVIPCIGTDCYRNASVTQATNGVNSSGEITQGHESTVWNIIGYDEPEPGAKAFDLESIPEELRNEDITSVEIDVSIKQLRDDLVLPREPVEIDQITVENNSTLPGSCEEIRQSSEFDFKGSIFTTYIDMNDDPRVEERQEVKCDLDKGGSTGWTRFQWRNGDDIEQEFEDFNDISDHDLNDCDINYESCISSVDDLQPDNIGSNETGKIMIKSIEDDSTSKWAIFEFDHDNNPYVDEVSAINQLQEYFGHGTKESFDEVASGPDGDGGCYFAVSSSPAYDNPCVSAVTGGDSEVITDSDGHIRVDAVVEGDDFSLTFVEPPIFERNIGGDLDDPLYVDDNPQCLGIEADACEIYYAVTEDTSEQSFSIDDIDQPATTDDTIVLSASTDVGNTDDVETIEWDLGNGRSQEGDIDESIISSTFYDEPGTYIVQADFLDEDGDIIDRDAQRIEIFQSFESFKIDVSQTEITPGTEIELGLDFVSDNLDEEEVTNVEWSLPDRESFEVGNTDSIVRTIESEGNVDSEGMYDIKAIATLEDGLEVEQQTQINIQNEIYFEDGFEGGSANSEWELNDFEVSNACQYESHNSALFAGNEDSSGPDSEGERSATVDIDGIPSDEEQILIQFDMGISAGAAWDTDCTRYDMSNNDQPMFLFDDVDDPDSSDSKVVFDTVKQDHTAPYVWDPRDETGLAGTFEKEIDPSEHISDGTLTLRWYNDVLDESLVGDEWAIDDVKVESAVLD